MPPKPMLGPGGIRKDPEALRAASELLNIKHNKNPAHLAATELIKKKIGGAGGMRKIPSMKEGGMVEKTMLHHLHKGEMVVPAHLVKHFSKLMKK